MKQPYTRKEKFFIASLSLPVITPLIFLALSYLPNFDSKNTFIVTMIASLVFGIAPYLFYLVIIFAIGRKLIKFLARYWYIPTISFWIYFVLQLKIITAFTSAQSMQPIIFMIHNEWKMLYVAVAAFGFFYETIARIIYATYSLFSLNKSNA